MTRMLLLIATMCSVSALGAPVYDPCGVIECANRNAASQQDLMRVCRCCSSEDHGGVALNHYRELLEHSEKVPLELVCQAPHPEQNFLEKYHNAPAVQEALAKDAGPDGSPFGRQKKMPTLMRLLYDALFIHHDTDEARMLIEECGANVNASLNVKGQTLLHVACTHTPIDSALVDFLLLEQGALCSRKDGDGKTAEEYLSLSIEPHHRTGSMLQPGIRLRFLIGVHNAFVPLRKGLEKRGIEPIRVDSRQDEENNSAHESQTSTRADTTELEQER